MKYVPAALLAVFWIGAMLILPAQCMNTNPTRPGQDPYDLCVAKGEAFFREAGMWPVMDDGRRSEDVARGRCMQNASAFGSVG